MNLLEAHAEGMGNKEIQKILRSHSHETNWSTEFYQIRPCVCYIECLRIIPVRRIEANIIEAGDHVKNVEDQEEDRILWYHKRT